MRLKSRPWLLAAFGAMILGVPAAIGHPDHGSGSKELFPGEGVAHDDQHGLTEGHLPPVSRGVRFVGKAEVTNPSRDGNDGRIADVSAFGNHAFLTAFREPTCERTGA